jgi:hypothetical protein
VRRSQSEGVAIDDTNAPESNKPFALADLQMIQAPSGIAVIRHLAN